MLFRQARYAVLVQNVLSFFTMFIMYTVSAFRSTLPLVGSVVSPLTSSVLLQTRDLTCGVASVEVSV